MMRSAWLVILGGVACGGARTGTTVDNRGGDVSGWVGHYACSIEQGGWRYSLYACDITSTHGRLELTKTEGQMQLTGAIEPTGDGGFRWRGEVWCTYTDACRGPVEATFAAIEGGGWEAHLPAYPQHAGDTMAPMVVTIIPESTASAGGGVRYGGYGAGGWTGGAYTGEVPVQ